MRIVFLILCCILIWTPSASADEAPATLDEFAGFIIDGEIINPKCVKLLQTWDSEKSSIIVQSVVLETCQNSNLAFEGRKYKVHKDGTVLFHDEPDDPRSRFTYRVAGKTDSGFHVLDHGGYVGIYHIERRELNFDLNAGARRPVHVLSKIGSTSFLHCLKAVRVIGDVLQIEKAVFDPNQARAFQCTDKLETVRIDVGK